MGCVQTKEAPAPDGVPEVEPPKAPDPRVPLTARQLFSISKSWKGIARAMEPTGVHMFIRLFEEHSELLELFSKFQHLKTREAQAESMELQEHATLVMSTLDESIQRMDQVDFFRDYLHNVGRMHLKIQDFRSEYFWKMEKPFLDAVQMTLGDRYTENMESIYKVTIHYILETLVEGFDQGKNET